MITKSEQETIICFNEEDTVGHVFTYNKAWQRNLEDRLGIKPDYENKFGGKEYTINKKMIKMPRAKRQISEETRKALLDRMNEINSARKKSTGSAVK